MKIQSLMHRYKALCEDTKPYAEIQSLMQRRGIYLGLKLWKWLLNAYFWSKRDFMITQFEFVRNNISNGGGFITSGYLYQNL